jgi:hypothetical protein
MGQRAAPPWFELPAISQISVSSPHVLRAFHGYNAHRPVKDQIRPFNFCLSAHVAPFGHPEGVDPLRFHLVAPYSDDPRTYLGLNWVDRFSGDGYSVTTQDDFGSTGAVLLQTYGHVFARYARHPEAKSLDTSGSPGRANGLLARRPVREGSRAFVGKESNRIEEVDMGLWQRLEGVMIEYGRMHDPWNSFVVPVLQEIALSDLMAESGLDRRTLQRARNRHSRPHRRNEVILTEVAGSWARQQLSAAGATPPRGDVLACRAWVELQQN